MRVSKKFKLYLMLVSAALLSALPASSTFATSIYDDSLVTTSNLLYYGDDWNDTIDVSSTWRTHMRAACGSTVYSDFLGALNGGAWAVSQVSDGGYGIAVTWSKPDNTLPDTSFYSYGTDKWLGVSPGYYGRAVFSYNSYLDQDVCQYSTTASYHSNNWEAVLSQENWTSPYGLFQSTYDIEYPTGYEGDTVPIGVANPIVGTAQCGFGNNTITKISIDAQSGVDGDAVIWNDSSGGKNYSYYLSEDSPYQVKVECDNSIFLSPLISSSLYYNYSWACTVEGSQYICAAS